MDMWLALTPVPTLTSTRPTSLIVERSTTNRSLEPSEITYARLDRSSTVASPSTVPASELPHATAIAAQPTAPNHPRIFVCSLAICRLSCLSLPDGENSGADRARDRCAQRQSNIERSASLTRETRIVAAPGRFPGSWVRRRSGLHATG